MDPLAELVFVSELGLIYIVWLLAPGLGPRPSKENPMNFDKPGPEEGLEFAAYEAQEQYREELAAAESHGVPEAPADEPWVA